MRFHRGFKINENRFWTPLEPNLHKNCAEKGPRGVRKIAEMDENGRFWTPFGAEPP